MKIRSSIKSYFFLISITCALVTSCRSGISQNPKGNAEVVGKFDDQCLSVKCSWNELYQLVIVHHRSNVPQLEQYLETNWESLKNENGEKIYILLGHFAYLNKLEQYHSQAYSSPMLFNYFLRGLYECESSLCQSWYQKNKSELLLIANKSGSQHSSAYLKLIRLKRTLPWSQKSQDFRNSLALINESKEVEFKNWFLLELVKIIPNFKDLKLYVADHFIKNNDEKASRIYSFYLARYLDGWHDKFANEVLATGREGLIEQYIETMPVGCPAKSTVLTFKKYLNKSHSSVLKLVLDDKDLKENFSHFKLEGQADTESKCLMN